MRTAALLSLLVACGCSTPGVGGDWRGHEAVVELRDGHFRIQEPIEASVRCRVLFGGVLAGLHLPGIAFDEPALWAAAEAEMHRLAAGRALIHATHDLTVVGVPGLYNVYRLTLTADAVSFTR